MPPVLAFIGKPDCGKTTLIEKLIPALAAQGISVGTIKHHHGDIQMDIPGKDTWRHMQAGARAVLLASPTGIGYIRKVTSEIPIETLVEHYFQEVNLVIAEGYKEAKIPKIEVFRSSIYHEPLPEPAGNLIATVSDVRIRPALPWFKPENIEELAEFLLERIIH